MNYVPVLRWKRGEQEALKMLSEDIKHEVVPLIDFPTKSKMDSPRLTNFVKTAVECIGVEKPFYIDFSKVEITPVCKPNCLYSLLQSVKENSLEVIPIISTHLASFFKESIISSLKSNFCSTLAFRMSENDSESVMNSIIKDSLQDTNLSLEQTDLIIDLGNISERNITAKKRSLNSMLSNINTNHKNIIVISGAIPQNNNFVATDSTALIPRSDWNFWRKIHSDPSTKNIIFGDFTTTPCEIADVPYQGAPKIKYTLNDKWFVSKGHRPRSADNQRIKQSQAVIKQPFYRGKDYSFGDSRIYLCAIGSWGPGNPTNWVTNDINQHITFSESQVSSILSVP